MQGFNMGRYYPPDASNPPAFNTNSHPLGKRASKISQGILVVRFELPFAVWCDHCKPTALIGQGVRFNAEKKKIGKYYSTPIWSFRMKHSACGGWWEIHTDPQNTEYVVVEGAHRRDYGPTRTGDEEDGELKMLTQEERDKRREDIFASLEGRLEEKAAEKNQKDRVVELYEANEVWKDPYEANARLRREFRADRKVRKKEDRHKEGMQEKFGLGIDIADETDADRMRAKMVDFGDVEQDAAGGVAWKPLFAESETSKAVEVASKTGRLKSEIAAEKSRQLLQKTLIDNTRAVTDPFLTDPFLTKTKGSSASSRLNLGLLKRKRDAPSDTTAAKKRETATESLPKDSKDAAEVPAKKPVLPIPLVGYTSDSDSP
ncbi:DUF572-domain-containing protein [Pyrenochaeta sp. DS3sAY3a]|nr:DUF572-domain-containing protein [Pyrenochaeta sp. DS3sAY3a]